MTPTPATLGPTPVPGRKSPLRFVAPLLVVLALYGIDLACVTTVPAAAADYVRAIAVPFDLMVCVPAVFYLLVIRRNNLSSALLLPVIALGGAASFALAPAGQFSLYFPLAVAALALEITIAVRESRKVVRAYRQAKQESTRPNDWFTAAVFALVRNQRVARMASLELTVEWYLLRSWKREPDVPAGYRAFTYHQQSGYTALIGVMVAIMLVETVAVHLLVAQWSILAACILTLLSLYSCVFMIGDARAAVLNPLLVGENELIARWGSYFYERIPLDAIASVGTSEPSPNAPKSERLSMAAMGGNPCWIEFARPVEVSTITGTTRSIRWLAISPDNPTAFKHTIAEATANRT